MLIVMFLPAEAHREENLSFTFHLSSALEIGRSLHGLGCNGWIVQETLAFSNWNRYGLFYFSLSSLHNPSWQKSFYCLSIPESEFSLDSEFNKVKILYFYHPIKLKENSSSKVKWHKVIWRKFLYDLLELELLSYRYWSHYSFLALHVGLLKGG